MEVFADFLVNIETRAHRERTKYVLDWINTQFPPYSCENKMELANVYTSRHIYYCL